MAIKDTTTPRAMLEQKKARLLEEAAAVDREMADIARLEREAARYGLIVTTPDSKPLSKRRVQSTESKPHKNKRRASRGGSVASLIESYRTDERSTFQKLRYQTRQHYDSQFGFIEQDMGPQQISEIKSSDLVQQHQQWLKRGAAQAHSLVGMLRVLFNFGGATLGDSECERLAVALHNMRVSGGKSNNANKQTLTAEHVEAIIKTAKETGVHSIALAQAFQFYCKLAQRDCIGEWIPNSEPGLSDVIYKDEKWLRGIRWEEIDGDFILRHATSKGGKQIKVALPERLVNMIGFTDRSSGPIIICEGTGRPWRAWDFRMAWRKVAREAGVPDEIKNMTSRPSKGRGEEEDTESAHG
jgi:hypothetical protein